MKMKSARNSGFSANLATLLPSLPFPQACPSVPSPPGAVSCAALHRRDADVKCAARDCCSVTGQCFHRVGGGGRWGRVIGVREEGGRVVRLNGVVLGLREKRKERREGGREELLIGVMFFCCCCSWRW